MDKDKLSVDSLDYSQFLHTLKKRIRSHQLQAMRAVNKELLALYWEIGKSIQEKQCSLGWGKAIVQTLAQDLQAEFPGRNGFSSQNLWLMRQFYNAYSHNEKLQPLVREISWSKNLLVMARCKDELEKEFYLRATARYGWTKAVLQHQLDNQSYQKYLLGQTNFDKALPESIRSQAILAVKDYYSFDFLELSEAHSERELEQAVIIIVPTLQRGNASKDAPASINREKQDGKKSLRHHRTRPGTFYDLHYCGMVACIYPPRNNADYY